VTAELLVKDRLERLPNVKMSHWTNLSVKLTPEAEPREGLILKVIW